jgi:putative glutamine amidotransferase
MSKAIIGYTSRDGLLSVLHMLIAISIYIAGGKPLRLNPKNPKYNKQLDGIIIGGGTDLYPVKYDMDPKPDYTYDHPRDEMEFRWMEIADKENIPVLGICRGAQLMNVHRGGGLHMDILKIHEKADYPTGLMANIFFRKNVTIAKKSIMFNIFKTQNLSVNSMHKQAIDRLGDGLMISANEKNGIAQAVEDPDRLFFMGVQFHPEAMIHKKQFRDFFRHFINTARLKKGE